MVKLIIMSVLLGVAAVWLLTGLIALRWTERELDVYNGLYEDDTLYKLFIEKSIGNDFLRTITWAAMELVMVLAGPAMLLLITRNKLRIKIMMAIAKAKVKREISRFEKEFRKVFKKSKKLKVECTIFEKDKEA